jgi:maleate isomerase
MNLEPDSGEASAEPALRVGVLTPHRATGPEAEFPEMAPARVVVRVERLARDRDPGSIGSSPPSSTDLREATAPPLLDRAARKLVEEGIDVIAYASTTSAYAMGYDAEAAMISRLSQTFGVRAASTCASAVLALHTLRVDRLALVGAPWFEPEFNTLGATYFREQGFEVVSSTSAELTEDPRRIDSTSVYHWTSRHVGDDADAIFIGGNGFRAVGAIERLEGTLGRPVLTSNQVLLWNLIHDADVSIAVEGYGRLFMLRS